MPSAKETQEDIETQDLDDIFGEEEDDSQNESEVDAETEEDSASFDGEDLSAKVEGDSREEEGELAVDVYQTNQDVVIQATVAGVRPEALDVSIEDDLVVIQGKRKNPLHDEAKQYYHQECFWGPFSREIILPEDVDAGRAEATFKDGLLTVRIPRITREKNKKVKVKQSS